MKKKKASKDLPKGQVNLDEHIENAQLIEYLIKDELFIKSIEDSEGPLKRLWPDWYRGKLFYEMKDGSLKESDLYLIIEKLKKINYLKEFSH